MLDKMLMVVYGIDHSVHNQDLGVLKEEPNPEVFGNVVIMLILKMEPNTKLSIISISEVTPLLKIMLLLDILQKLRLHNNNDFK